jgi:hypothetical protein
MTKQQCVVLSKHQLQSVLGGHDPHVFDTDDPRATYFVKKLKSAKDYVEISVSRQLSSSATENAKTFTVGKEIYENLIKPLSTVQNALKSGWKIETDENGNKTAIGLDD